ncbi:hypothetical protein RJ639_032078 [Escallonia herrerae]|uniref:Acid phosphatase/vanadium-dependent haloperoxidase-related protein n=1 Tax=Escallonia herrerae TaxID=1293975 RepID=A0AA88X0A7_9ASTE|nr:hypothetical protein RJ639_032078 [Escallonia herrerae]
MDSLSINSSLNPFSFSLYAPAIRCRSFLYTKLNCFIKKPRTSSLSVSCNCHSNPNSSNPTSQWQNHAPQAKPFWYFASFLPSKASITKWVSVFRQKYAEFDAATDELNGNYLQNGGFGMALLSVTSTAKVRISPFVATLAANPTFVSGFFAWLIAQSMKVFLHFCFEKKWDLRIICASGGMPSSHSALCTALTTSVAICHGVADSLFPVCLGFSLIVMYDAIGVRRHAGMQAEVLNMIVEDLFQGHPISQRKLKELLGHTPIQVCAGALLGIVVACVCCQGCLIAI